MVDICYWFFRFSLCFFCIFILEPLLKFIYFQFNSSILICYISHFSIWSFFFWFLFFFLGPFVKVLMVFNFIIQSMFMVFYFSNLILILFIFFIDFFLFNSNPNQNLFLPSNLFFISIFNLIVLIDIYFFYYRSFHVIDFSPYFHPLIFNFLRIGFLSFSMYDASGLMTWWYDPSKVRFEF
jgi:hypothetical protein